MSDAAVLVGFPFCDEVPGPHSAVVEHATHETILTTVPDFSPMLAPFLVLGMSEIAQLNGSAGAGKGEGWP